MLYVGASIAEGIAAVDGTRYYKLRTISRKNINELLSRADELLKNVLYVIFFLNSNNLAATTKVRIHGQTHTHIRKHLTKVHSIGPYLRLYLQLVKGLPDQKIYFFSNLARNMNKKCHCARTAFFKPSRQFVLFKNIENGLVKLCSKEKNFGGVFTHKNLMRTLLKELLDDKKRKITTAKNIKIYDLLLGKDGVHIRNVHNDLLGKIVRNYLACNLEA